MSAPVDIDGSGIPRDPSQAPAEEPDVPTLGKPPRTVLHWLVDGHWLGRWRTPLLLKIWRYGAGSIVAFVTSGVAFYICIDWFGLGAITCSVIAFFAGAVPNWVLNRRWAWQKRGREGVGRETTLYVVVSLISLVASAIVTKLTALGTAHSGHMVKDVLVTLSYLFSVVVLSGLKYLAYDRFVFVDRRRSRSQVPTTTEQNLAP
ncbi:MAG: GtrA family protein [Acidimicrobiales bacterium]|jgi:putative flippase GtrA